MINHPLDSSFLNTQSEGAWSDIHVFDCLDSTNNWVKAQSLSPLVCLAEAQTEGRGRNGNRWQSPDAQNVYLSYNWTFDQLPKNLPLLSLWVGIAVAESLEALGIDGHGIKWPNDLYWKNKKLGGILIETSNASSTVIVGIGINVNASEIDAVDQPWTSLNAVTGKPVNRNQFVASLLNKLFEFMTAFSGLNTNHLLLAWERWDVVKGKTISFQSHGQSLEGVARGINEQGHLLVDTGEGEAKPFNTTISRVRW